MHGDAMSGFGVADRCTADRGNHGRKAEDHTAHHSKNLRFVTVRVESRQSFSMLERTFAKLAPEPPVDCVSRWIPAFMQCNRRAQVILLPHLGNNEHRDAPLLRAKESERKLTP